MLRPEIMQGKWIEAETTEGTEWIPFENVAPLGDASELRDYCEGEVQSYEIREGFGARLTAPGYLDATDWVVFDDLEAAWRYLLELHADAFIWTWEPGHGYHRNCEDETCARVLVETVQSIDGEKVERDGTFVYTVSHVVDGPSSDLLDFTVEEK